TTPRTTAPTPTPPRTPPETTVQAPATTPLNTNVVTEVGSWLGLTERQTPATIDVVNQRMIIEQGYRTVSETAQGAVGVTAGDAPGAPSAFSMRGYSFSEINVLYNGIKVGPQSMTSRIMETGNLDRVEYLKGPSSLMTGEGATGGS